MVDLEPTVTKRGVGGGVTSFVFALVGLAASTYLTIEHFNTAVTLACPESATINCAKVTSSAWSHIGPVPVALLGLIFFAVMSVACSPPACRRAARDGHDCEEDQPEQRHRNRADVRPGAAGHLGAVDGCRFGAGQGHCGVE